MSHASSPDAWPSAWPTFRALTIAAIVSVSGACWSTAFVYESTALLGEALHDVRDDVYLSTKTGGLDAKSARSDIEEELRLLQTDHVDCAKLHNVGLSAYNMPTDAIRDRYMPVIDELETMRDEGKIVNIGLSTHINFEAAYKLIDSGRFDEVLLARSYFPTGMREILWQRNLQWRDLAVGRAHELGMNIIGMKAMASVIFGHGSQSAEDDTFRMGPHVLVPDFPREKIDRLPGAALRWVFADPRFHIYSVGMSTKDDIDTDIAICGGDMTLTNDDLMLLADLSVRVWDADHIKGYKHDIHRNYGDRYAPKPDDVASLTTIAAEPHLDVT